MVTTIKAASTKKIESWRFSNSYCYGPSILQGFIVHLGFLPWGEADGAKGLSFIMGQ